MKIYLKEGYGRRIKSLAIPAVALIFAVLAWIDVAPYRTALNALPAKMTPAALEASKNDVEADINRFSACSNMRKENPGTKDFEYPPDWRICLLNAMPKTKTAMGALGFSMATSNWLTKHPGDEEMRTAALATIAHGRDELVREKPWRYDSLEELAEAHDRSIIFRLRDGRQYTTSLFSFLADKLDQAELAVMLPDVARKQEQWRRKELTGGS